MILLAHALFGAVIGALVKNIPLAIALAILSHYLLDFLPHTEYPIKNIQRRQWRKSLPDASKVLLDLLIGFSVISMFANGQLVIYACGAVALLPDALTLLYYITQNKILGFHFNLHQKIHFFQKRKNLRFWRILSQALIIFISVSVLILV